MIFFLPGGVKGKRWYVSVRETPRDVVTTLKVGILCSIQVRVTVEVHMCLAHVDMCQNTGSEVIFFITFPYVFCTQESFPQGLQEMDNSVVFFPKNPDPGKCKKHVCQRHVQTCTWHMLTCADMYDIRVGEISISGWDTGPSVLYLGKACVGEEDKRSTLAQRCKSRWNFSVSM